MDTSKLFSDTHALLTVFIAVVAIVPGIWALVHQAKIDRESVARSVHSLQTSFNSGVIDELWDLRKSISGLKTETKWLWEDTSVDKLWEKMYEKPVIVRCGYCNSPNVITSISCSQCGAPAENFVATERKT